ESEFTIVSLSFYNYLFYRYDPSLHDAQQTCTAPVLPKLTQST
ncbi:MAG: hypothetical protein ACI8XC_003415, partial [Gammaproteobacteria bacterium]